MHKLIWTAAVTLVFASSAIANPWKVQEGSTLLDGTETATRVAGYMFSGKEYEMTSSQVLLSCEDQQLEMIIVGDSELLKKEAAEENPNVDFMFKAGDELISVQATIESVDWNREQARVHNGPGLLEFLRKYDGGSAEVQLPVARTGVPEVRKLSLENIASTTDLVLATCGPLKVWEAAETAKVEPAEKPEVPSNKPPQDIETALSVGLAQQIVETLIADNGVTIEQIVEALEPLLVKSGE